MGRGREVRGTQEWQKEGGDEGKERERDELEGSAFRVDGTRERGAVKKTLAQAKQGRRLIKQSAKACGMFPQGSLCKGGSERNMACIAASSRRSR